jgi:cyclopropane fatty-acyl-phospholipid synthase-like methyltransferase/methyltransferase-like protein
VTRTASENPYEQIAYPNWTHHETHPRQLEATARLFGLNPAAVTGCRVLELGCAAGWNLIPMAQSLPGSTFVGIDSSPSQITEARKLATEAGIGNVRLEQADILDVDESWGQFDYIICHGIYSWVPAPAREKIFDICKINLAADGVALVSYNVYPGWHVRKMVRDMMLYHITREAAPLEQVTQARSMLDLVAQNCPPGNTYQAILKHEAEQNAGKSDAQFFHDQLEEVNYPVYFHQFIAQAEGFDLQYVTDMQFSHMPTRFLSKTAQEALVNLDIVKQEQNLDFMLNRSFRRTLLCHSPRALERIPHADTMNGFYVALAMPIEAEKINLDSDDPIRFKIGELKVMNSQPIVKAAIKCLAASWPEGLLFEDLHTTALTMLPTGRRVVYERDEAASRKMLVDSLLMYRGVALANIWLNPPSDLATLPLAERPVALPVARIQAKQGNSASNARHQQIKLDEVERHIIAALDGKHDRPALLKILQDSAATDPGLTTPGGEILRAVNDEELSQILEAALLRLRNSALLIFKGQN